MARKHCGRNDINNPRSSWRCTWSSLSSLSLVQAVPKKNPTSTTRHPAVASASQADTQTPASVFKKYMYAAGHRIFSFKDL